MALVFGKQDGGCGVSLVDQQREKDQTKTQHSRDLPGAQRGRGNVYSNGKQQVVLTAGPHLGGLVHTPRYHVRSFRIDGLQREERKKEREEEEEREKQEQGRRGRARKRRRAKQREPTPPSPREPRRIV